MILNKLPNGEQLVNHHVHPKSEIEGNDAAEPTQTCVLPPVWSLGEERKCHGNERQSQEEEEEYPFNDRRREPTEREISYEGMALPGVHEVGAGEYQSGG